MPDVVPESRRDLMRRIAELEAALTRWRQIAAAEKQRADGLEERSRLAWRVTSHPRSIASSREPER